MRMAIGVASVTFILKSSTLVLNLNTTMKTRRMRMKMETRAKRKTGVGTMNSCLAHGTCPTPSGVNALH